ncbi:MAG: hypothetical protein M3409_00095, partial [Gemmatimonadota bacterium]|nr:hypothetical protein [Gemmatimonadota bacterium]
AGWIAAHVGDVRILSRSPDGTLRLETRDHTPAYARWEAGEVALDAIPDTAGANRLQRAVGRGGEADAVWIPLRPGWRYLLISDGVSKAMRLDELGDALAAPSAAEACAIIARKVAERGPDDNYTAVVVRVSGEPEDRTPTPAPPLFNGAPPVSRPARTPSWLVALSLLNLLLLGALGWAAWSAWQTATSAAPSADLARVRAGMDSLRAEVDSLRAASADTLLDPFAPQNVGASPIPASPLVPNRR